jgi:hypothetical protein
VVANINDQRLGSVIDLLIAARQELYSAGEALREVTDGRSAIDLPQPVVDVLAEVDLMSSRAGDLAQDLKGVELG